MNILKMGYYDLSKHDRLAMNAKIEKDVLKAIQKNTSLGDVSYMSDEDTYIRKVAYQSIGKLYKTNIQLRRIIITRIKDAYTSSDEFVRQTATNAMGEIGINDPEAIGDFFDTAAKDDSPKVRNAVIGSLKKIGRKNSEVAIEFTKRNIKNSDEEVRRIAIHGLELRGRTYPEDVLPILKAFQNESKARLKKMLIHVIGQVSYKKGCLEKVLSELKDWQPSIVVEALKEIYAVHVYYADFAQYDSENVRNIILSEFQNVLDVNLLKEIEDIYITPGKKVAGRNNIVHE